MTAPVPPSTRCNPWLLLLAALLLAFLSLTAWSIRRAHHDVSAVTDRDYYDHGLRLNDTLLERQAAARSGWHITLNLDGGRLRVELRDSRSALVTGAHGQFFYRPPRGDNETTLDLTETAAGHYELALPAGIPVQLPARLVFDRQGLHLERRLLITPHA